MGGRVRRGLAPLFPSWGFFFAPAGPQNFDDSGRRPTPPGQKTMLFERRRWPHASQALSIFWLQVVALGRERCLQQVSGEAGLAGSAKYAHGRDRHRPDRTAGQQVLGRTVFDGVQ